DQFSKSLRPCTGGAYRRASPSHTTGNRQSSARPCGGLDRTGHARRPRFSSGPRQRARRSHPSRPESAQETGADPSSVAIARRALFRPGWELQSPACPPDRASQGDRDTRVLPWQSRRSQRNPGSDALRSVAEKCVLFFAGQAAAPVLSRHCRPDVAAQKIQEICLAVSADHPTRKACLAFLKRTTNRLGLALARQFRDLGRQSLDVRVLDVERHRIPVWLAWCNLSTWV